VTLEEFKKKIKEKKIDRRSLAIKLGVSPAHLANMLNGWASLKIKYEKVIADELSETK
jgi:lambda repressor-like predicted transcriptional regulator